MSKKYKIKKSKVGIVTNSLFVTMCL